MLTFFDDTKLERCFVATVVNRGNLAKMIAELKAEVAEGEEITIEIWKNASEEVKRKRIAKRRLDFFNS